MNSVLVLTGTDGILRNLAEKFYPIYPVEKNFLFIVVDYLMMIPEPGFCLEKDQLKSCLQSASKLYPWYNSGLCEWMFWSRTQTEIIRLPAINECC
jgi:hypothetical protein